MSILKFSPVIGTQYGIGTEPLTAAEYRKKHPIERWRYNPWTGNPRTKADTVNDPQGFLMQPPVEQPVYAELEQRTLPGSVADSVVGKPSATPDTITITLTERGKRYGKFTGHAQISQDLEDVMRACPKWAALAADQKEALKMVVHKIARILNGDPDYDDSWVDIAGYAKLVADRLQGTER